MKTRAAVLASALCFAVAVSTVAQSHEFAPAESSWSLPAAGRPIEFFGGLGDLSIVKSDDDQVTVTVTRGAEGTVVPRIMVVENARGIFVCADWTTAAGAPSPCGTGKRRMATNAMKNYARADFRIAVPQGTALHALVSKGNIVAEPVAGSLRLATYDGNITGIADGPVFTADNLHGAIEMRVDERVQTQKLKAGTLDGTVHVIIPPERRLNFALYAAGAEMRSDFALEGQHDYAPKGATTHLYRLSENDIDGATGSPKTKAPWASLEVFVTNKDVGKIRFSKP